MLVSQEKLEHCLDSKTSLGEDLDGESISHLRSLQAKHEIFKAPAVSTAFNIASFSYNDRNAGQPVLVTSPPPPTKLWANPEIINYRTEYWSRIFLVLVWVSPLCACIFP